MASSIAQRLRAVGSRLAAVAKGCVAWWRSLEQVTQISLALLALAFGELAVGWRVYWGQGGLLGGSVG